MSYTTALEDTQSLTALLNNLLTGDDTYSEQNLDSVRKFVKENILKATIYSQFRNYNPGEIVSYNENIYLAITESIDKQPDLNEDDWLFIGNNNVDDIYRLTAAIKFDGLGNIVNSRGNKFLSIEQITTGKFRVHFKSTAYTSNTRYFVKIDAENRTQGSFKKYNTLIIGRTTQYFDFQSYSFTDINFLDCDYYSIELMEVN